MTNDKRLCIESRDFWRSCTPSAKKCLASATTTLICSQRWFARGSDRDSAPPDTFAALIREHPLHTTRTQTHAQDKGMTRRFYAVMIPVMMIGSVVCVRSEARPSQGKT